MKRGTAQNKTVTETRLPAEGGGAGASLLSLADQDGVDLGAMLLRLAHRAAAQHRLQAATQHQSATSPARDGAGGAR